ncbi:MAG TPA: septation protein SepH [Actinomycetota bacterium]|nr:septation protein SepH [Actinomycetota bacterium]
MAGRGQDDPSEAHAKKSVNGIVTLKPIGVTEDGLYVTLARRSNAKSGGWRVAVDRELIDKLEEALTRASPPPPPEPEPPPEPVRSPLRAPELPAHRPSPAAPGSRLSPKEIQALLRQGRSVAAIARKAEVSEEWVERFEGPIIWERAGMCTRARKATLVRTRRGESALPLGEAVDAKLKEKKVKLSPNERDEAWDATRHPRTGNWVIKFSYPHRNRQVTARWEFDPENGSIRALDSLANDLGWVESRGRRRAE